MYIDLTPFKFLIKRLTCPTHVCVIVDDHCVCRQKKRQNYQSTFLVQSDWIVWSLTLPYAYRVEVSVFQYHSILFSSWLVPILLSGSIFQMTYHSSVNHKHNPWLWCLGNIIINSEIVCQGSPTLGSSIFKVMLYHVWVGWISMSPGVFM